MRKSLRPSLLRKMLKCIFLFFTMLISVFFFQSKLQAQNIKKKKRLNSFAPISIHSLNFVVLSGLTQKGQINRLEGNEQVKSDIQPHFEGGIDYQHKLRNKYFTGAGIHLVFTSRNLIYKVPVEKINSNLYQEPYPPTKFTDFDISIAIPFFIERQWKVSTNRNIYARLGLQFHYSFESDISYGDSYIDTTNHYIEVFHLDLNTNNKNKLWVTFSPGCGYQWQLKNNNLLRLGLTADFSFSHYTSGVYQINIPGENETSGRYRVSGSYIALSASYGLTGLNRKWVHRYEE